MERLVLRRRDTLAIVTEVKADVMGTDSGELGRSISQSKNEPVLV